MSYTYFVQTFLSSWCGPLGEAQVLLATQIMIMCDVVWELEKFFSQFYATTLFNNPKIRPLFGATTIFSDPKSDVPVFVDRCHSTATQRGGVRNLATRQLYGAPVVPGV